MRQTTLEIDLKRLKKNFELLANKAKGKEILVLLKSDAYGHSHSAVSQALDKFTPEQGLHGFGVANVEEGIELRREGIRKPVYVLSGIQHYDSDLDRCLQTCDLIPVISSLRILNQAASTTKSLGVSRIVHLKFNTGMNRLGIDLDELKDCLRILKLNPQIVVRGLMSHLAIGELKSNVLTKRQEKEFARVCDEFAALGMEIQWRHLCNSAGLESGLFPRGNLVRLVLSMYGLGNDKLFPVAKWTAQVYQIRELKKGESVGYGATYRSKKKMKMAVLGVGYGDGYRRIFSNRAQVLIRGKRCNVIGTVSMDLTMVDVTDVRGVTTEDRAVLLGCDGKDQIRAEELAKIANTISWEILTGISTRVPRVFL